MVKNTCTVTVPNGSRICGARTLVEAAVSNGSRVRSEIKQILHMRRSPMRAVSKIK
jgi:hypothetical protein